MLGAVVFGHQQMQPVIDLINELADEAGKPLWDWIAAGEGHSSDRAQSAQIAEASCRKPMRIRQKQARSEKVEALRNKVMSRAGARAAEPSGSSNIWCARLFSDLEVQDRSQRRS